MDLARYILHTPIKYFYEIYWLHEYFPLILSLNALGLRKILKCLWINCMGMFFLENYLVSRATHWILKHLGPGSLLVCRHRLISTRPDKQHFKNTILNTENGKANVKMAGNIANAIESQWNGTYVQKQIYPLRLFLIIREYATWIFYLSWELMKYIFETHW